MPIYIYINVYIYIVIPVENACIAVFVHKFVSKFIQHFDRGTKFSLFEPGKPPVRNRKN